MPLDQTPVNVSLSIDLEGVEDKWSTSGCSICADCGRDFDSDDNPDGGPLQLFRGEGDAMEMLSLCWSPCAFLRLKNKHGN